MISINLTTRTPEDGPLVALCSVGLPRGCGLTTFHFPVQVLLTEPHASVDVGDEDLTPQQQAELATLFSMIQAEDTPSTSPVSSIRSRATARAPAEIAAWIRRLAARGRPSGYGHTLQNLSMGRYG